MLRDRLWIVLVEPEGAINFGFILRLARNFGIKGIYVVNPKFDIRDDEVRRFAARGEELLYVDGFIKEYSSLSECIGEFDFSICTTAKSGSESDVLRQVVNPKYLRAIIPSKGKVALVFGRESVGLKREELMLCDVLTTLETGTEYNTLNLSHSVAIFLYMLLLADTESEELMLGEGVDSQRMRYVTKLISEIASYVEVPEAETALRHILSRSCLRRAEYSAIYKFFKRIKYKLVG